MISTRLTVDRPALVNALTALRTVVPTKASQPAIESVEASCLADRLVLRGTDLERHATSSVEVLGPGQLAPTTFHLTAALAFLKAAEGRKLTIEPVGSAEGGNRLSLRTELGEVLESDAESVDEFPCRPETPLGSRLAVPSNWLRDALTRVLPSAAREMGRYAMHGVLLEADGRTLSLVATDGRRLAIAKRDGVTVFGPEPQATVASARAIVPGSAIQYLTRHLPKDESEIVLTFPEAGSECARVQFTWAGGELLARPIDGEFPRYHAVIRASSENYATVDSDELTRRVKTVSSACSDDARAVKVEADDGALLLVGRTARATSSARVAASLELGSPSSIALNPAYLLDGLRACGKGLVRLGWCDKAGPMQLDVDGFRYVQMPITLDG